MLAVPTVPVGAHELGRLLADVCFSSTTCTAPTYCPSFQFFEAEDK